MTSSRSHGKAEKAAEEPSSQPGGAPYDSWAPPRCPLTVLSVLSSVSADSENNGKVRFLEKGHVDGNPSSVSVSLGMLFSLPWMSSSA